MALEQVADPAADWWTDNAPPAPTGPITSDSDPRLSNGAYASDPAVLAWLNRAGGPGDTNAATRPTAPAASGGGTQWILDALSAAQSTDDPSYWIDKWNKGELGTDQNWVVDAINHGDGALGVRNGTVQKRGADSNGFGSTPNQYASNPNAPQYVQPATPANLSTPYQTQGTAPTRPDFTPYKAPTLADLLASPGYSARLNAVEQAGQRRAAGKGTILNGGTQIALDRADQDYASNEYDNLFGQGLAVNQNNNNLLQAGFGDDLNSFTTTNQFGLQARQQNQNEFQQNVVDPAQRTFQNQYTSYLNENARTLNDYLTNYNIKHTAETDYWNRSNDVANRGLQAAGAGRAA